jgi:O-antigen/teichoic acid export membrane protein
MTIKLQQKQPDPRMKGFLRTMGVLISGAAGAHFITAAALPVLSRLYAPSDFGTLALFTGIIATVGVAACLRYDVAVALPESDEDALALLLVSLGCAALVTFICAMVLVVFGHRLVQWDPRTWQGQPLWLIPCGIFVAAVFSALQNWSIRVKDFAQIAKVRLGQSAAGGGIQISMGLAGGGVFGLLSGPVAGFAVGATFLGLRMRRSLIASVLGVFTAMRMRRVAWEYRRFPAYSTWEALANSAAIHIPILLIATIATKTEAGYLMLAMYAMQAPMSLIGNATAQVYLSRAPEAHRQGELSAFTAQLLGNLARGGVGPVIAIGIISPAMFPLVFGADWSRAGWLVTWMTPWFVFQFLASPISMALHVTGNQRTAMLLQIFGFLVRVSAVLVASTVDPSQVAEWYAVSGALLYLAYLVIVLWILRVNLNSISRLAIAALLWATPWIALSMFGVMGVKYFSHGSL